MGIKFLQVNLQHATAATALMLTVLSESLTNVTLVQEPWIGGDGKLKGLGEFKGDVFCSDPDQKPRTCILTTKVDATCLPQFRTRDLVAIKLLVCSQGGSTREVIVASSYFPYDSDISPPPQEVKQLVQFCKKNKYPLILGCDSNAHNEIWGSSNNNSRGLDLMDYLIETELILLNRGSKPTFRNSIREEVLDVTIATRDLELEVVGWQVTDEESLSDHAHIRFELSGSEIEEQVYFRNPKATDWSLYREELLKTLSSVPITTGCPEEIETLANSIEAAIVGAYHLACPLRKTRYRKRAPWWTGEVEKLRRVTRKFKNRFVRTKTDGDRIAYEQSKRTYKREIRRSKRMSWRKYCEEMEGQTELSRLQKAMSKDRRIADGPLMDGGEMTSSHEEALKVLMNKHFPGCVLTAEDEIDEGNFDLIRAPEKMITVAKIKHAMESFSPFKSPGPDGIFPALLQHGVSELTPYLLALFKGSFELGYIPKTWREVRISFIPKPGKTDYTLAASFRPISLCSFLLKIAERLADWHLRQTISFHSSQHAYRSGRSTESALHALITKVERSLQAKELALSVSADIEGAFNNVSTAAIVRGLERKDVDSCLKRWIVHMLQQRKVFGNRGRTTVWAQVRRGCPQGGVLSPLIWITVLDEILEVLASMGVSVIAYSDDLLLLISGSVPSIIFDLMRDALEVVSGWCHGKGLSINPEKLQAVLFTNKRNLSLPSLTIAGIAIELSSHFKYLGVWIDRKLQWKLHIEKAVAKARAVFWTMRNCFSSTWGLTPKSVMWIYQAIARPMLTYGCVVWWQRALLQESQQQLDRLQRMVCIGATGAIRSTPTSALQVLFNLPPLHIFIKLQALNSLHRLQQMQQLCVPKPGESGHVTLLQTCSNNYMSMPQDPIPKTLIFCPDSSFLVPEREDWSRGDSGVLTELNLDETWFTDGSLIENSAGAGLHCQTDGYDACVSMGKHATVFQAEVYAIKMALDICTEKQLHCKKVGIFSDSQAAIAALAKPEVTSKLVKECKNSLNKLSATNEVSLIWVPGHTGISGNEKADELARTGSKRPLTGPEPFLPLASCAVRKEITSALEKESLNHWRRSPGAIHSKACLEGFSKKSSSQMLALSRNNARIVVAMLTGHGPFRAHLEKIGVNVETVNCRFCEQDAETGWHILSSCAALWRARLEHFGFAVGPESKESLPGITPFTVKAFCLSIGLTY